MEASAVGHTVSLHQPLSLLMTLERKGSGQLSSPPQGLYLGALFIPPCLIDGLYSFLFYLIPNSQSFSEQLVGYLHCVCSSPLSACVYIHVQMYAVHQGAWFNIPLNGAHSFLSDSLSLRPLLTI